MSGFIVTPRAAETFVTNPTTRSEVKYCGATATGASHNCQKYGFFLGQGGLGGQGDKGTRGGGKEERVDGNSLYFFFRALAKVICDIMKNLSFTPGMTELKNEIQSS